MRRSVQPNRPNAMTWCFFASLKMLAIRRRDHSPCRRVNVLSAYILWPVFRCPSMAGFGCPPRSGGCFIATPSFPRSNALARRVAHQPRGRAVDPDLSERPQGSGRSDPATTYSVPNLAEQPRPCTPAHLALVLEDRLPMILHREADPEHRQTTLHASCRPSPRDALPNRCH